MLPSAPYVAALVLVSRHGERARVVADDALRTCKAAGDAVGERAWSDILSELPHRDSAKRAEPARAMAGALLH